MSGEMSGEMSERPDTQRIVSFVNGQDILQAVDNSEQDTSPVHDRDESHLLEDEAVSYAVEVSIKEQITREAASGISQNPSKPARTDTPDLQKAMMDYMECMRLRSSNEFSTLDHGDADTLVYVGPPPQLPRQSHSDYQHVRNHYEKPLFVRSSILRGLQSQYFNDLLGPKSLRTEKRLRKHGILQRVSATKLATIKYFIDLQPKIEDDEGVILVANLTCSAGVLKWYLAQKKYSIPRNLVLGSDHLDTPANPYYAFTQYRTPTFSDDASKAGGKDMDEKIYKSLEGDAKQEYCQLRHRSGIERLLQAVEGNDPKLDSAPKVWTFFALANFFNCAHHESIRKWVVAWLYNTSNANFIQCNPETVYRMGMGIQNANMVRDAFSILVGEKALIMVYGEAKPDIYSPLVRSVHGRPLVDLDDNERDRIDHAAFSLVQRVRHMFGSLTRSTLWLNDSPTYNLLDQIEAYDDRQAGALELARELIEDFVRGRIHWVLCQHVALDAQLSPEIDYQANDVHAFYFGAPRPFLEVYNILNQPMRLFTRTLWIALLRTSFEYGQGNTDSEGTPGGPGVTHLAQAMIDAAPIDPLNGIKAVNRSHIFLAIRDINNFTGARFEAANYTNRSSSVSTAPIPTAPPVITNRHHGDGSVTKEHPPQEATTTGERDEDTPMTADTDIFHLELHSPKRTSTSQATPDSTEKRRRLADPLSDYSASARGKTDFTTTQTQLRYRNPLFPSGPDPSVTVYPVPPPNFGRTSTGVSFPSITDYPAGLQDSSNTSTGINRRKVDSKDKTSPAISQTVDQKPSANPSPSLQSKTNTPTRISNERPGNRNQHGREVVTVDDYLRRMQDRRQGPVSHAYPLHPSRAPPSQLSAHESLQTSGDAFQSAPRVLQQFSDTNDTRPLQHAPKDSSSAVPVKSPSPPEPGVAQYSSKIINPLNMDLAKMLNEISALLHQKCNNILYPTHLFHSTDLIPTSLVDTLMCLDEDEWKYLPLWADGLDDGTGGVFDEANVPNLESGGFRGGKRGMKGMGDGTKLKFENSDEVASLSTDTASTYDDIASDAVSTLGKASKRATDGTETVKSINSDLSSERDFMAQNDIYRQIMEMKMDQDQPSIQSKAKAADLTGGINGAHLETLLDEAGDSNNDFDFDGEDDEEGDANSTIMGAGSEDVQGDMFHDLDDDNDNDEDTQANNNGGTRLETDDTTHHETALQRTVTTIPIRSVPTAQSKSTEPKSPDKETSDFEDAVYIDTADEEDDDIEII